MLIRRATRLPLVALWLAALATACGTGDESSYSPESVDRAVLVHFRSCEDLLGYAQYRALDQVGAYGFEGEYGWGWDEGLDGGGEGGDGPPGGDGGQGNTGGGEGDGGDGATPDYSGTNVQELGVDEPDIIKTDGERILVLAQGALHYIDAMGAEGPAMVSSLPVLAGQGEYYGYDASEMLVLGDRVLITVHRGGWDLPLAIREGFGISEEDYRPMVQLVEVDISDPSQMKLVSSLYVEGAYVSARLHGDTARVVLSSQIYTLPFRYPWDLLDEDDIVVDEWSGGWDELAYARAEAEAESYNRRIVRDTEIADWIPSYVLEQHGADAKLDSGLLVDCERMMRPGTHAGLGTLAVLTVDLGQSLALRDAVGVFSEGQTVYASQDNLYVATRPFYREEEIEAFGQDPELDITSYVHKFDITSDDAVYYVASGEVPGSLLSQWSMSEYEGDLRVATTEWGWGELSESYVSVLRERGQELELIGQVGGLGRGEQIYAVRFIDDVGYVVTFRQVDPLYTVDLADPVAPAVVGELKIEGYSAYLHPMGEGLLLGVGREGNADGQIMGSQISLFDVSNPADPQRLYNSSFGEWGSSEVEFDHRAFLWWGAENLAVFPVTSWGWDEETGEDLSFNGALVYRVDPAAGIEFVGTLEHEADPSGEQWYGNNIRRSLVIGDELFTMSNEGLMRNDLGDLSDRGWVSF